jgi:hypothetical protein
MKFVFAIVIVLMVGFLAIPCNLPGDRHPTPTLPTPTPMSIPATPMPAPTPPPPTPTPMSIPATPMPASTPVFPQAPDPLINLVPKHFWTPTPSAAPTHTPAPTPTALPADRLVVYIHPPNNIYTVMHPLNWDYELFSGVNTIRFISKVVFSSPPPNQYNINLVIEQANRDPYEYELEIFADKSLERARTEEVSVFLGFEEGYNMIKSLYGSNEWSVKYSHHCKQSSQVCFSEERYVKAGNYFYRMKVTGFSDSTQSEKNLLQTMLRSFIPH